MRDRFWVVLFLISDFLSASVAWSAFFYLRQTRLEKNSFNIDSNFFYGVIIIPILWVLLYYIQGTYISIRQMFRLKIVNLTLTSSFLGVIFIFFLLLLDDVVQSYKIYYQSIILLLALHFTLTVFPRLIINSFLIWHIRKPGKGFSTIILGGNEKAVEIYKEMVSHPQNVNSFIGYINVNGKDHLLAEYLDYLGHEVDLERILTENKVEEVIIAIESSDHSRLKDFLVRIDDGHLRIKTLPDAYVILSGSVKMTNIYGALLLELKSDIMPFWQQAIKRSMDLIFSLMALILLIPFFIFSAIAVKISSPGPILFLQDRVGMNGSIFKIIKFRTMYVDSEKLGPQLSSENDSRITRIGLFMRKTRLDEFPQFINVLFGQMSLVGPRPERQFYIDQIVKLEAQYLHLNRVRPGITSWGQVKYGYAENVDQMLQRMKFDLIYLKNRSLALDIKIMFYTFIIVLKAKGK